MKGWISCAAALALAVGCNDPAKVVVPQSPSNVNQVHPDLPSPNGFEYTKNISDTNPTGDFRVVTQELEGKEQRTSVAAAFFKDTYPRHHWTLEKEEGDGKTAAALTFVKKDERCRIEIKDASSTLVKISLKVTRKN
jgi:hypothetical protein